MNPLLQATLLHPHDRDAHAVYADWLIQQGSPLGHAINAELAGVHGLALARLYTPCIEAILGPLLPYVRPLEIRWGRCVRGLLHQEAEDRRHPFWSVLELPKGPSGRPIRLPDNRFMPVWPLSEGIDRRIWLAWDVERQRSVTLAMLDEEFSPIRLVPTEHSTGIEVYPAALEPLPPQPWPAALRQAVQALQAYVETDLDRPLHPLFHQQVFLLDGAPVLLGTPYRPPELGDVPPIPPGTCWAAGQTRGWSRSYDEDGWVVVADRFVVLDVMGGQGRGDWATFLTSRAMAAGHPLPLREQVLAGHEALAAHEQAAGATVVAAQVRRGHAEVVWSGDCRLYRLGADGLEQVTRDHTLVNRLLDEGRITHEALATHPQRDILLRSLGHRGGDVETLTVPLQPGDRLLLCTDGVWRQLEPAALHQALLLPTPPDVVQRVLDELRTRKTRDNAALIVIDPTG